ncbi:MAG: hypothetical protein HY236_16775 [Acidobacteria bacterium]|nr:hypothetical protein [Acidobacteriota bacterium]
MNEPTETPAGPYVCRRTEEIALDLMKFVALTTGYGKMQGGAGFSGKPATRTNEEYAESLLQLYERCRQIVEKKAG